MKSVFLLTLLLVLGFIGTRSASGNVIYEPYTITTVAGWGDNQHTVDGPTDVAEFDNPDGLAVDKDGNIFVSDYFGFTIRKITPDGVASTFAGKADEPGSVDGTRGDARFNFPMGLAMASAGRMYVADSYNQTIREITNRGVVTTFAGLAGIAGFVDGVGSEARFNGPSGVTVNKSGDVFVADSYNKAVRKITPDATVTTVAAGLDYPQDIAVDRSGNLYVIENTFQTDVRKITPDGVITNFAELSWPHGIAIDRAGNLFVADGTQLKKISPTGEVSEFAGGEFAGSEDGVGSAAQFSWPMRVALDRGGNLFVSDAQEFSALWANNTIRKIAPSAVVTTFCGVSDMGSRDGIATKARFFWARGVVANPAGAYYVADSYNQTIRKIDADGVVTTIAGKVQTPGYVDGTGRKARFNSPYAVALDPSGNLFVADWGNHVIRKVIPDTRDVSTIANGYDFSSPSGVAVDGAGNVFVSATNNHTIDKVSPAGEVTILAGTPGQKGLRDGPGQRARFDSPAGLALDAQGNIYVADTNNDAIRKIAPDAVVTTLAGGVYHGSEDGIGKDAGFRSPCGVAVDSAGNVYVTDYGNATLRKVTPAGSTTTLAGIPLKTGWIDETGSEARLSSPYGITVDGGGSLYFADVFNDTIRKGSPASR